MYQSADKRQRRQENEEEDFNVNFNVNSKNDNEDSEPVELKTVLGRKKKSTMLLEKLEM